MITAGIDIGSRSTNVVVLKGGDILATLVVSTGANSVQTSSRALDLAIEEAGIARKDVNYLIATGYGRVIVPFADEMVTEISCHAKGANYYFPSVRTILDMGGQDCKAIRCDGKGNATNFVMNDKCAAGTGRFLEIMADAVGVPLVEIGDLSLQHEQEINISSMCTVFAKSEVMTLMRQGKDKRDILAGVHEAVTRRVLGLIRRVKVEEDFAITGGVAKNIGVVRRVEKALQVNALLPQESQIVGALGAALFAAERGR